VDFAVMGQTVKPNLRFSLRTSMVIIAAAAVGAFVAAPYLRSLSAEQWWRMAETFAAAVTGAAVWAGAAPWLHRRAQLRAGQRLVGPTLFRGTFARRMHVFVILVFLLLIVFSCYLAADIRPKGSDWARRYMNPCLWGVIVAQQWTFHIGSYRVAFCENGIVWYGCLFTPWSRVHVLEWNRAAGRLTLLLKGTRMSFEVTDNDWSVIGKLLRGDVSI
jgi:hypothetical protein